MKHQTKRMLTLSKYHMSTEHMHEIMQTLSKENKNLKN